MPDRRSFLLSMTAAAASPWLPIDADARETPHPHRTLILIELQGGNDALNTVIPTADPAYYALRPTLAIPASQTIPLDASTALHPALRPLMPLWQSGALAFVRGVGDAAGTTSHENAIAAWETAATAPGGDGRSWLERALELRGSLSRMEVVDGSAASGSPGDFRATAREAARLASTPDCPAVIKLSMKGYDTHAAQASTHAALLDALARGMARMADDLMRAGRWGSTLVMTYSEFGRRAVENHRGGTDHGAGGAQLLCGGAVRGGLYGATRLLADGAGLACDIDFRRIYASVLERWWGIPSVAILHGRYDPLPVLSA